MGEVKEEGRSGKFYVRTSEAADFTGPGIPKIIQTNHHHQHHLQTLNILLPLLLKLPSSRTAHPLDKIQQPNIPLRLPQQRRILLTRVTPKARSISSRVAFFVSGKKNHTHMIPIARNAAKKMYVPHFQACSMGGTKKAMAKLLTQLLEAPMEAPLARMDREKISEIRFQEQEPQPQPPLTNRFVGFECIWERRE